MDFIYTRIMDFSVSNISIQTSNPAIFLENSFHIVTVKLHFHHSHLTGKIP